MQAAHADHVLVLGVSHRSMALEELIPLRRRDRVLVSLVVEKGRVLVALLKIVILHREREAFFQSLLLGNEFGIATEQDVGSAPGHIGGDCDRILASGLSNDLCLTLVD